MKFKIFFLTLLISALSWGQTNIVSGGTYTENFNSLGASSTATLPTNWKAQKTTIVRDAAISYALGVAAVEQSGGNAMPTNATNGIYRYNANSVTTESALGGLSSSSSSKSVAFMTFFNNNSTTAITTFNISYDIEKYRNGSNAAGFSIELLYSIDGTTWSSCGSSFITSFGADTDNTGYTPTPNNTVSVTNTYSPLSSIALNGKFYFAWRYSVTSGTTTSNAQALGFDNVSITANPVSLPPVVTASTFSGVVGTAFSNTLIATPSATLGFTQTGGTLPPNLSINTTTGAITGNPSSAGTYTINVYGTNGAGSGSTVTITFNITLPPVPVVTASTFTGTVGTAFSNNLVATNSPTSYTKTGGALPPGLSMNSSGIITGTPTSAGPYTIIVTATNAGGTSDAVTISFTISNIPVPIITGDTALTAFLNSTYSYTIIATNLPTSYTLASGSLPPGLSLNPTTGIISGITSNTVASYPFTITAANAGGTSTAANFTITITNAPSEIDVQGNMISIVDGDITPATADWTDFGSIGVGGNLTRTFTISNTGYGALTLSGTSPYVTISGVNAGDFSVTTAPSNNVSFAGLTTFIVRFLPTAVGLRTATIIINNNDSDEGVYDFTIQGTGTASIPSIVTSGTVSAMCVSSSTQNASMVYTSSTNSPTSYGIDWNAAANTAGLLDQGNTAYSFAAGGGTLNTIVISANTAAGQYTGVMTITNASLSSSTYTVTIKIGKQWNGSDIASPTDWNVANNWTPSGVPTATDCVVIPNGVPSPLVSGTNYIAYMDSISISNNNSLNVASGNTLVVTNTVNVAIGGNLNILNNGSLVQLNNVANVGSITYNRTANGIRGFDYVYWSSPVSGASISSIYSNPISGDKYSWNPLANNVNSPLSVGNWEVATGTMGRGVGYIVRGSSSFGMPATNITGVFTGVPNNGLINNIVVSRGNNTVASSVGNNGAIVTNLDDNWNLIGNPYPSAIKALDFLNANSNLQGFVNIWTHRQSPTVSTNPFYGTFISNYDLNDYIVYNGTGTQSGPTGFNGYIAAGQAFFVSMNDGPQASGLVQFNNSMRSSAYSNSQFYKSTNETEKHRIWLDLVDSNNNSDRTLIGYVSGASVGYDRLFDANTNSANSRSIYSVLDDTSLTIQGRSLPFEETDEVVLGINILTSGNYSIAISAVDGLFEQNQPIYLEDKFLNITHNLKESPYSFSSLNGTFNNRFLLKYTDTLLDTTTFDATQNQVLIVTKEQQMEIKSSTFSISNVTIYDLLGRLVVSKSNIATNEISIHSLPSHQVLIVKIQLENGELVTRKVVL
jgi:hypothetical protein